MKMIYYPPACYKRGKKARGSQRVAGESPARIARFKKEI